MEEFDFTKDIYYQVIQELGKNSENNNVFRRVAENQEKPKRLNIFFITLLFVVLTIISSSLLASYFVSQKGLVLNFYLVALITLIFSLLTDEVLNSRFTVLGLIITFSVSAFFHFFTLKPNIFVSEVINIAKDVPISFVWLIASLVQVLTMLLMNFLIIISADTFFDMTGLFLPILPTTLGKSVPKINTEAYKILDEKIGENWKQELNYVIVAAQAELDSAEVRVMPWVVLLGIGVFSNPEKITEMSQWVLLMRNILVNPTIYGLVFLGTLGILNIARVSYFQSSLIQMSARLLDERYKQEKSSRGCLFGNLFR
jgi:hypothetical protein